MSIEEAGPAVGEFMEFSHASGLDTPGCRCGHDTLGPDWHGDECPVPGRLWRGFALDLARRADRVVDPAVAFAPYPPDGSHS